MEEFSPGMLLFILHALVSEDALMPGRRGTEARRLALAVTVRMDADLAARCQQEALSKGLSTAGWLRNLAVNEVGCAPYTLVRSKPRIKMKPRPDKSLRYFREVLGGLDVLIETVRALEESQSDSVIVERDELRSLSDVLRETTSAVVNGIEASTRE